MTVTADHALHPKVVIAHDYVTQKGGAERVVLGLLRAFPGARLVTSVYNQKTTFSDFANVDVETLWLSKVPLFRRDPRLAFPLLARAWEQHVITDADVVITSSSGWAHGVSTSAPKVVYCHNPARWLYQAHDYLMDANPLVRVMRNALADDLIDWDRRVAADAAAYVANSNAVAGRILEAYTRDCHVIPPPIALDPDGEQELVAGLEPGFLLSVSRNRGYKNVELVCDAVEGMPEERLVVLGDLPERSSWSPRLHGAGRVSDAQLRWLYANCKAVVSASHEDFGLTPLEGNLFGKPAVLLRAGGFLDTLVEGITGCFIEAETVESVQAAIRSMPTVDPVLLRAYAGGFREEVFARRMAEVVSSVLTPAVPVQPSPPRGRVARASTSQKR